MTGQALLVGMSRPRSATARSTAATRPTSIPLGSVLAAMTGRIAGAAVRSGSFSAGPDGLGRGCEGAALPPAAQEAGGVRDPGLSTRVAIDPRRDEPERARLHARAPWLASRRRPGARLRGDRRRAGARRSRGRWRPAEPRHRGSGSAASPSERRRRGQRGDRGPDRRRESCRHDGLRLDGLRQPRCATR